MAETHRPDPRDEAEERLRSFQEEALPHLEAIYRFAVRLTRSEDRADDLTQETFLRAYRAWDQYTRGTYCKSWLFTICRNAFLREREKRERRRDLLAEQTPVRDGDDHAREALLSSTQELDPEAAFYREIVDGEVVAAVDALPERYRLPIVLSDVEGLNYGEVAEVLEIPVGTVKSRLFRGRRRLQESLRDYAVSMGYIRPRRENGSGETTPVAASA